MTSRAGSAHRRSLGRMRHDPTGLMRPCPECKKPMLGTTAGRGFCLACADPSGGGVPLVPVTSSPKRFMRLKSVWERAVMEYNKTVREEFQIPLVRTGRWSPPTSRGGAPRKLTDKHLPLVKSLLDSPGYTVLARRLTAKGVTTNARSVRRYCEQHGLRLNHRPSR
jgi:hypothetical protein